MAANAHSTAAPRRWATAVFLKFTNSDDRLVEFAALRIEGDHALGRVGLRIVLDGYGGRGETLGNPVGNPSPCEVTRGRTTNGRMPEAYHNLSGPLAQAQGGMLISSAPSVKNAPPALKYQSGFGNEFATEAIEGALPIGQNSPQRAAFGLYTELVSGTAFTAPRHSNRRTWVYRVRPSAAHGAYRPLPHPLLTGTPFAETTPPNRLRWDPLPLPAASDSIDFIDGLVTYAGNGNIEAQQGCAAHVYCANASMRRVFTNSDGELLIVPQQGSLVLETELGRLAIGPGEIAVIPRGIKFRVLLIDDIVRGYVCENFGSALRLPELGPIGSNGLANARDFETPVAWFEESDAPTEIVTKFLGKLWGTTLTHSPFEVVAWHGNYVPYKYDLSRFNTVNTVSFDHIDPSIFTVLTSLSDTPGTANVDFVIFPPRWVVSERTFRPPWYHRNFMSEFMGLVRGIYDAKLEGFSPGGASLHNCMVAHGPDQASYERAVAADLKPYYMADTLAFMFESRYIFRPTSFAIDSPIRQRDYDDCWAGLQTHFKRP